VEKYIELSKLSTKNRVPSQNNWGIDQSKSNLYTCKMYGVIAAYFTELLLPISVYKESVVKYKPAQK
jgi:hypothetical protein